MNSDFVSSKTSAANLAKLMSLEDPAWSDQDLSAMLRHQLDVKMKFDLNHLTAGEATRDAISLPASGEVRISINELLAQSDPDERLLRLLKEFFKLSRADPQSLLPTDIATVLYYVAIVAARLRKKAKITSLDDDALRNGIRWSLERPWLEPQLKSLFNDALEIQK